MSVDLDPNSDQLSLFSLEVAFSQSDPVVGPSVPARHVYLVYCNVQDATGPSPLSGPLVRGGATNGTLRPNFLSESVFSDDALCLSGVVLPSNTPSNRVAPGDVGSFVGSCIDRIAKILGRSTA